jgi:hypothetical protein
MRRSIKKQRLREMSRALIFSFDEHPYKTRRQRVLRLLQLEDFPHPEHPYRTGAALSTFLGMFIKSLTGGKSLIVFG